MLEIEENLYKEGFTKIVGVDEAGRGPVAGPVVAAAVIFPKGIKPFLFKDSKKLSEKKRYFYLQEIKEKAISIGIGLASNIEIDKINIYNATKLAMTRAIDNLKMDFDYIISDFVKLGDLPHLAIKKADEISLSVAAASIVAKIYRDELMKNYSEIYPHSFDKHKGYLTDLHKEEIRIFGLTPIHRLSFKVSI